MFEIKQTAKLTNLQITNELHGDEPIRVIELSLTFSAVPCALLAPLFYPDGDPDVFKESFWDEDGDALYFCLPKMKLRDRRYRDCYTAAMLSHKPAVEYLKDFAVHLVGNYSAELSLKVRVLDPPDSLIVATSKKQRQDFMVELIPGENAKPETDDAQSGLEI